jgi:hypothetical protein
MHDNHFVATSMGLLQTINFICERVFEVPAGKFSPCLNFVEKVGNDKH